MTAKLFIKYSFENHNTATLVQGLLSKTLVEVLKSLHVLAVLAILKISTPKTEEYVWVNKAL